MALHQISDARVGLRVRGRSTDCQRARARFGCAAIASIASLGWIGTAQADPTDIPAALALTAHEVLVVKALGVGTQIYTCAPTKDDPTVFSWAFVTPDATLFANDGHRLGTHYAGPTWENKDGSKIAGTVKAQVDSPSKSAIPWLLLQARPIVSDGKFGAVRSVLRMHTVGGVAPSIPCNAALAGRVARVPYSADYYFYAPDTARPKKTP